MRYECLARPQRQGQRTAHPPWHRTIWWKGAITDDGDDEAVNEAAKDTDDGTMIEARGAEERKKEEEEDVKEDGGGSTNISEAVAASKAERPCVAIRASLNSKVGTEKNMLGKYALSAA